jgi:hypothetical protein
MSQNSLVVANGTGAAVRAALNNALDTLGTLNSGASAPSTTQAYLLWADTTTGLLKIRNAANSAWIVVGRLASIGLGRILNSTVAKTGAYTVVAADEGVLIKASGTWTLSLTAAATLGDGFAFGVVNTGTGVITIDPNASETIDGQTTLILNPGDMAIPVCDASNFRNAARYVATAGTVDFAQLLQNAVLAASVSGNALTFALKTKAGTDPSASDPVKVAFRSATLTDGAYVVRSITAALSLTISAGSTLGTANNVAARLRAYLIDNAGTVEMAAYHAQGSNSLLALDESALHFTTAEGGAGGADSAQVLYSASARSSVAVRELGFCEITEATAGTWATAPAKVQTMGPGVPRCGQLMQPVCLAVSGEVATGTTTIPADDTIPQQTEGDEYQSKGITPTSASNWLIIDHVGQYYGTVATGHTMTVALFQDATASAVKVAVVEQAANYMHQISLHHEMRAGTVLSTNFKIRVGMDNAGTTTFNGRVGARRYGGVLGSYLRIQEVFA